VEPGRRAGHLDRPGIGQRVLVVGAVVLLVLGLRRPGRRRVAAISAWSLIPLAIAWIVIWTVQAEHSFWATG
jgi:hypothetical protein